MILADGERARPKRSLSLLSWLGADPRAPRKIREDQEDADADQDEEEDIQPLLQLPLSLPLPVSVWACSVYVEDVEYVERMIRVSKGLSRSGQ